MPDNIPQWPFMPAIQGQVPLPRPDPRQDKSIAFARALMAGKPSVPLPTPDPRDWATRSIHAGDESGTSGAIHPDALMNARGIQPPSGHSVDTNQWDGYPGNNGMPANQFPMGMSPPPMQQDVSNGLFGVPPQHLQQMAGDVIPLPLPQTPGALTDLINKQGANEAASRKGGYGWSNKNIDFKLLDSLGKQAANQPPKPPTPASGQNLPQIPTSGFEPSLSPNYFSSDNPWTNRNQQPGAPPTFWQPG